MTGAASGIGLAIAEQLSAAGMWVVMTDLDGDAVAGAASAIGERGFAVEAIRLDVRDPDAVEAAARYAVDRFGALHVAVNNAGIVNRGYSWELSLEEWRRVIDVNPWGVVHGVRSFVPRIMESGGTRGRTSSPTTMPPTPSKRVSTRFSRRAQT